MCSTDRYLWTISFFYLTTAQYITQTKNQARLLYDIRYCDDGTSIASSTSNDGATSKIERVSSAVSSCQLEQVRGFHADICGHLLTALCNEEDYWVRNQSVSWLNW